MMQVTEAKAETRVVLTKPLTLEEEEADVDYAAPNPLQLVLSLFKNVMPGSDLTRFQASLFRNIFNIWTRVPLSSST